VKRKGMTLLELLVTLAIMGALLGVVTLAVRRIAPPDPDDPYHIVVDSLRAAVVHGQPVTLRFVVQGVAAAATVYPDGSVVGDSLLAIERLTGKTPNGR
jgi:prepilin-type N-terminal cleavage/methylation domain-containing protein